MDLTGLIERFDYNGSLKDIPIPSKLNFKKDLILKCRSIIARIRWEVFFKNKKESTSLKDHNKEPITNYTSDYKRLFKSRKAPPSSHLLYKFEDAIWNLVNNIQYKRYPNRRNPYLRDLALKVKDLSIDDRVLIFSDKTRNIYRISPFIYDELLMKELCKKYKVVRKSFLVNLNKRIKLVMDELDISDRTEPIVPREPRISIKDHKLNYITNPSVRLICPNSSDIGRISKDILDRYIPRFRASSKLNLWVNSYEALNWFKDIENKPEWRFLQVDIVDYYSSINEIVLNKALIYVKNKFGMTRKEIDLIKLARIGVLKYRNKFWIRRNTRDGFDIAIGASDSAEVTDIVGLYFLDKLKELIPELYGGLYRDDGLFIVRKTTPRKFEYFKKKLHEFFRNEGLKIIIEPNNIEVNFLDITFNLFNSSFTPYHKPNENLKYINIASNHPPSIKNSLKLNISKRISSLSANKLIFDQYVNYYNNALKAAGYKFNLQYIDENEKNNNNSENITLINSNNKMNNSINKEINKNVNINKLLYSSNNNNIYRNKNKNNKRKLNKYIPIIDNFDKRFKSFNYSQNKRNFWIIVPYGNQIKTNIIKELLIIFKKYLDKDPKLCHIINSKHFRFGYSVSQNMASIILRNNNVKMYKYYRNLGLIQNENRNNIESLCNCRAYTGCIVKDKLCRLNDVVYLASVKTKTNIYNYVGSTSNQLKVRIANHKQTFNNYNLRNATSLSRKIWDLKRKNEDFRISWEVILKSYSYKGKTRYCGLCMAEILTILESGRNCLNYRNDYNGFCRHFNKFSFLYNNLDEL